MLLDIYVYVSQSHNKCVFNLFVTGPATVSCRLIQPHQRHETFRPKTTCSRHSSVTSHGRWALAPSFETGMHMYNNCRGICRSRTATVEGALSTYCNLLAMTYQSPPVCRRGPSWADPLHILLGWSRCHRSASGLQSARVRRRPTNVWIDGSERCCWSDGSYVDLYRVRRVVNELKSTQAQSIQDRVDLARYQSPITALRRTRYDSLWCWCPASRVCSRPRHDTRITSTMWLASVSISCASYASSDVPWRQMLHTRWFGLWSTLESTTATDFSLLVRSTCSRSYSLSFTQPPDLIVSCTCFWHYATAAALARDARSR